MHTQGFEIVILVYPSEKHVGIVVKRYTGGR